MKRDSNAFNMKPSLNFVDELEDPADDYYLEDFIKGFEILKIRIDKLRAYSNDLDSVVIAYSPVTLEIIEKHGGEEESIDGNN